jgi:DNA-binding IclR family transcriptional regulator
VNPAVDSRGGVLPDDRTGRVQSIDRAAALLRAVAQAGPDGAPVAVLATATGLNRATAWRLLATLEDNGLLERDSASRYVLGPGIARLAGAAPVDGIVRRVHPILERLCAQTGETADLAVVRSTGLTYVDEVAPATVMTANWLGRHVPLHATSSGKTWLAWLPDRESESLLTEPREKFTDTTITGADQLRVELATIRSRGYGTCAGEFESQLFGVSAPVLDGRRPIAVVSIWGPRNRLTADRFPTLGEQAIDAAAEIAMALGISTGRDR